MADLSFLVDFVVALIVGLGASAAMSVVMRWISRPRLLMSRRRLLILRRRRQRDHGVTPWVPGGDEARDAGEIRRMRIHRLQESLRESMDLLVELDRDIAAGQERAAELEQEIDRNSQLAKLTQEQAEALRGLVADAVGTSLGRSERRAFLQQFVLNLFFFGLGVAVTLVVS